MKMSTIVSALCVCCFFAGLLHGNEARLTHTLYIDSETYREFSYDELVDCFRNFCLCRDGFGRDYVYQWLQLMKIDRNKLHRALMQVYGDMDNMCKTKDFSRDDYQVAIVGKKRILMFMSFCADSNDYKMFYSIYTDSTEELDVRAGAFYTHLIAVDNRDVAKVIMKIADYIDQPVKIRSFMYSRIKASARWAPVEKRTAMVAALKDVAMLENSKFMFVALDDIFKYLDNTYAKSQFRRDFAKRFKDTPLTERETKALQPVFDEKMNECFNEDAEVKPLRYVPRTYGPFISYEESILGITPQQRRIRAMAKVTVVLSAVAALSAVAIFLSKRRRKCV
ncbi:MAG: hypothetical protein IJU44_08425 [Kiritimatiellae bacterium]|nr:hypothetical protein [Kiritimatiellia bacterium]